MIRRKPNLISKYLDNVKDNLSSIANGTNINATAGTQYGAFAFIAGNTYKIENKTSSSLNFYTFTDNSSSGTEIDTVLNLVSSNSSTFVATNDAPAYKLVCVAAGNVNIKNISLGIYKTENAVEQLDEDTTELIKNLKYYTGRRGIGQIIRNSYLKTSGVSNPVTIEVAQYASRIDAIMLHSGETLHVEASGGGSLAVIAVSQDDNISNAKSYIMANSSTIGSEYRYTAESDCYVWASSNGNTVLNGYIDFNATFETINRDSDSYTLLLSNVSHANIKSCLSDNVTLISSGQGQFNVCGKNMIDPTVSRLVGKSSEWVANGDGSYSMSATAAGKYIRFNRVQCVKGRMYTWSFNATNISGTFGANLLNSSYVGQLSNSKMVSTSGRHTISFMPKETQSLSLVIFNNTPTASVTIEEIQCEFNYFATEYEPYSGGMIILTDNSIYPVTSLLSKAGETNIFLAGSTDATFNAKVKINNAEYVKELQDHTNIITVGTDKEFTSLKEAIDMCVNPSPHNRYVIEFYGDGTEYDLSEDTIAWNAEHPDSPVGLKLPMYTTLKGVGGYEKCILVLRLNDPNNTISPLNIRTTSNIEGITVIGNNTKYVVHDDFAVDYGETEYARTITNCYFKGEHLVGAIVWGAGCHSGCRWTFEDCVFEATYPNNYPFTCHNNGGFTNSSTLTFINCRCESTNGSGMGFGSISNNANNIINNVLLYGNKLNKLTFNEQNPSTYGRGIMFRASGYANDIKTNDVIIINTDEYDYSSRFNLR